MPLGLPAPLLARLWAQAQDAMPRECVGLLGGRGDHVRTVYPLTNTALDPERAYRADALELLRAFRAMDREGLTLLGIYHSHPRGPARPSGTDRALAAYPVPYLILDPVGRELRAYRLPEGEEVSVQVLPG